MRYPVVVAAIIFLVSLLPVLVASALAQDAERGTTLVCYAGRGEAISLVEWTPEQVADYEAREGNDVAKLAPSPATGDCTDLAGIMGAWGRSTHWRCSQDAEGRWRGPDWIYP